MEPEGASVWKREAAQVFEAAASYYDSGREGSRWYLTQVDFSMKALAGESGRVLDLGCAAGYEITVLRAAGFTVVGADYVHRMLLSSQRRFSKDPNVGLARADAEYLPFAASSFDHVVCLGVLEYLPDYGRALAEVHRVLKPGGAAVLALPSRRSLFHLSHTVEQATIGPLWRAAKRMLGKPLVAMVPPHHQNTCIPSRFMAELENVGLHPVDYANTCFFVSPLDRLWPTVQERLALRLERFGRNPLLGWMGRQFMVAVRKRSKPGF